MCIALGVNPNYNTLFVVYQEGFQLAQNPSTLTIGLVPHSNYTPWGQQVPRQSNSSAIAICTKCTAETDLVLDAMCCASNTYPTVNVLQCTCSDGGPCVDCGYSLDSLSVLCSPVLSTCWNNISQTDKRTWCCTSGNPSVGLGFDCVCNTFPTSLCVLCKSAAGANILVPVLAALVILCVLLLGWYSQ